jgi:glycosyltransferase involved in cell wall biosynthesis
MIETRSSFSLLSVRQLRAHLRRLRVDVLITHGYKSNLVGYLATRFPGVIQIPYVRGYTAENRRIQCYEVLDRLLLKRFPRILCVSEKTREMLAGYGIPPARIETVHNAVDCPSHLDANSLHQEFSIPSEGSLVVAAGRLSLEKGQQFLIAALKALSHREVHLVLFGTGREETQLREQVAALGLSDRVHFAGFRSNLSSYLATADLVVNPSLTEGLPNVVLEALAVGAPVVATDVGGVSEIISPGRTGWLVPPGDPEGLARAIEEALEDRELARRLGMQGRGKVNRLFSFDRQSRKLVRIYDEALAH